MKKKRVMFISSMGGHFNELMQLKSLFSSYDYSIVTEKTTSNKNIKNKFPKVSYLIYGTKLHLFSYLFIFIFNCFKSLFLFIKYRPKYIVTTGTHTAVPMCYIGFIFRRKIIYIETFANSKTRTVAGRIIYPIASKFIVQWESMLKLYPKAEYWGCIY